MTETTNDDHPINQIINRTVLELVKSLQVSLQDNELTPGDKIRAANIALSVSLDYYRKFINNLGAEITYNGLLQAMQAIHAELNLTAAEEPKID